MTSMFIFLHQMLLSPLKILWIDFSDDQEIFVITVDGIDCSIFEPRRIPSTEWFSHKYNGPGLSYELAIAIHQQKLVWIRGPRRSGKYNDNTYFKEDPDGLLPKIPAGKKVIADSLYKNAVCSIRNPLDTPEVRKFKQRARARHENFNGRLKNFSILAEKFCHGHQKHHWVFEAICVITQYEIEGGHPLIDV